MSAGLELEAMYRGVDRRVAAGYTIDEAFASIPIPDGLDAGHWLDTSKLVYHIHRRTPFGQAVIGRLLEKTYRPGLLPGETESR